MRSVVVFPAPFGPRKPVTRPGSMVKLTSSTAVMSPKHLVSPQASMAAIVILLRPGARPC